MLFALHAIIKTVALLLLIIIIEQQRYDISHSCQTSAFL